MSSQHHNNKNNNWKKKRGNRRQNRYYPQNYDSCDENGEDMRNEEPTPSTSASGSQQPAMRQIPGFYIDPNTKKYYRIMPNVPGMAEGSTQAEIDEKEKIRLCRERLSQRSKRSAHYLPLLLRHLEVNVTNRAFPLLKAKWNIENERLRLIKNCPSHIVKMTVDHNYDSFVGCKYLYLDDEGTTLLGCWGVKHSHSTHQNYPSCARVVSYNVKIDPKLAESDSEKWDKLDVKSVEEKKDSFDLNTYGLNFQFVEDSISVDSTLVDMVLAPADIDVTCLLYATANSVYHTSGRIVTQCRIYLTAIDPLTKEEGKKMMGAPVYNTEWTVNEPIWSVAFNANNMQVGVGMERCGLIYDVLSEKSFKVTSGNKNVITQEYSNEGNYLYMGRRQAPMSCLDLRMQHNHQVAEFEHSKSTSFIRQMRIRSNYILSEKFGGEIKLWDIRMRRVVLDFDGHKNLSHKVPCFVDNNEQFVFAIGEDSLARGWSLSNGERVCEVPCAPSSYAMSDFPRLVYSNRWGGANGNSALVLAINGDLHVHELLL